LDYKLYQK